MKILKYEKKRDNRYIIYLDNNTNITLYDDVILSNNLLLTKSITYSEFTKIISDNKL